MSLTNRVMSRFLRRYTDALSLIHLLRHKQLTLLSPASWFDQNDAFGLDVYRQKMDAASVYALCFTTAAETAHHWQLFAGQNHGVCIQFHADRLKDHLARNYSHILHGPVQYLKLDEFKAAEPDVDDLPFLKRTTFADEREYRFVTTEVKLFATETYGIPITLDMIERIVFGPAMPRSIADTLKDVMTELDGCSGLKFMHSKLTNNQVWREALVRRADQITAL